MRRAEILAAAERIFVRDGCQGATIRKIADEVGVSSTALYIHFRDKDEILLEICQETMKAVLEHNTEISTRPIDAVSKVRLMLEGYMRFSLEHPKTYWLVFCAISDQVAAPKSSPLAELAARSYGLLGDAVAEIEREGRLRVGPADNAAQILWCACHGFGSLRISRPNLAWADGEAQIASMLDCLLGGLVARPS